MSEDKRPTRLAEIENEKTALREQMATIAAEWQGAVVKWARQQWDRDVQAALQANPEVVRSLAESGGLSKLKQDLDQLNASAPEKVAEQFDTASVWSHSAGTVFLSESSPRSTNTHFYSSYTVGQPPKSLDEPLRGVRGQALALLREVRLLEPSMREAAGGSGHRYPYAMSWSAEMLELISQYSERYQAFVTLDAEQEKIEAEIQKEEVARLWNEA